MARFFLLSLFALGASEFLAFLFRRLPSGWYGITEYPFERSITDSDADLRIGDNGGGNGVDAAVDGAKDTTRSGVVFGNSSRWTWGLLTKKVLLEPSTVDVVRVNNGDDDPDVNAVVGATAVGCDDG